MAHKRCLDSAYHKPTREQCFAEFWKAVPALIISDEARDKIKIATLEEEKTQIEKLNEDMEELRLWARIESEQRMALGKYLTTGEGTKEFPAHQQYLRKLKST